MREKQLLCFLSQAAWNLFNELRLPKGTKVTLKHVKSEVCMAKVDKRNVFSTSADVRTSVQSGKKKKTEVHFFVLLIIITI